MHIKFNYPDKVRKDFLEEFVAQLVERRHRLGLTQDDLNFKLGVADRLVSHWECGRRSPTAFHLFCWADALKGRLMFLPNVSSPEASCKTIANDNLQATKAPSNDNNRPIERTKQNTGT